MLEMLLMQYKDQFGEAFPLERFEGEAEIDVINIIYDCVLNNEIYTPGRPVPENRFPDAPHK